MRKEVKEKLQNNFDDMSKKIYEDESICDPKEIAEIFLNLSHMFGVAAKEFREALKKEGE